MFVEVISPANKQTKQNKNRRQEITTQVDALLYNLSIYIKQEKKQKQCIIVRLRNFENGRA